MILADFTYNKLLLIPETYATSVNVHGKNGIIIMLPTMRDFLPYLCIYTAISIN